MANVVNRITAEHRESVNTPDFPIADWIHNPPNWSAIKGWAQKYRVVTGDVVSLADAATQSAIDVADLTAQRDELANDIDRAESFLRAFALVVLDEFNNLRAQHGLNPRTIAQLKSAVRGKMNT